MDIHSRTAADRLLPADFFDRLDDLTGTGVDLLRGRIEGRR